MKIRPISRLLCCLALFLVSTLCVQAYTGGTGAGNDPYIVDNRDFTMDSGYYSIETDMDFAAGKFVKVGVSGRNNFLTIENGVTVNLTYFIVGDDVGSAGAVTVSGANFKPGTLVVGRYGEGMLNVVDGGSIVCSQLFVGTDEGGRGVVRVSGKGSLLKASTFISNSHKGAGEIDIDDGALVVAGKPDGADQSFFSVAAGKLRLNGGSLAFSGDILAGGTVAELDALYRFEWKRSGLWKPVSIAKLKVTYIDGVANKWADSPLYATYHDRIDLTGYTVVTADADYAWADAVPSDKPGWYKSSWFGWFYSDASMNGWIFSCQHGYIYVYDDSTPDELYFWDSSAQRFWFTSRNHYRYLYDYGDESWCFYDKGDYPHRRFYEYRIQSNVEESGLRGDK
jgi:T5SS/PEP-CTERM-associated repeat protein